MSDGQRADDETPGAEAAGSARAVSRASWLRARAPPARSLTDSVRARKHAVLAWFVFLACCGLLLGIALASEPQPPESQPSAYVWHLPRGFPVPAVPADNPMSDAKVALGERLFFEPRLSVTGRSSCASCHDPARSFTDGKAVASGATGESLPRGAMPLVNVAYNISFGWTNPQPRTLEAQMLEPMLNRHPVELGLAGREESVCAQLAADPAYAASFAASFPGDGAPVTLERIVKAIAAFERTLISGRSAFDRYVFDGEHTALSPEAKRGMALFFSADAGCSRCHSGFDFSGNWRDSQGETGKPGFASNGTTEGTIRVPTLRNAALTAPYMHDGRFPTLEAVVDYYSETSRRVRNAPVGTYDARLPRSALSAQQRADLVAFLASLTDESFVRRFASVNSAAVHR